MGTASVRTLLQLCLPLLEPCKVPAAPFTNYGCLPLSPDSASPSLRCPHHRLGNVPPFRPTRPPPSLCRIINRLTKDTADIDRQLGSNLGTAVRSFLQLLSSLVLMGCVAPLALPPLVVIMLGFYILFQFFQVSTRML